MSLDGFKQEVDQQADLKKQQDNSSEQADKKTEASDKPLEKTDFLKMTPDQLKATEASHQEYMKLSEQWKQESHQSQWEAKDKLAESMQTNLDWS